MPKSGDEVAAGQVTIAGMAWSQHTGIAGVEVAVDGGEWVAARIAGVPNDDTWVQWKAVVDVDEGGHMVKVRATDKDGLVQTGVETETGNVNSYTHIWVFADAADRANKRAAMQRDPAWASYLEKSAQAAYLVSQETKLMVPTSFFKP